MGEPLSQLGGLKALRICNNVSNMWFCALQLPTFVMTVMTVLAWAWWYLVYDHLYKTS